jgi:integrase/recombinase XerD
MVTLTERLDDYISVRRSLGYDLSFAARVLRGFTRFADREGTDHITVDLFLRWKKGFGKADNNTWSARLGMVPCSPAGCRVTMRAPRCRRPG